MRHHNVGAARAAGFATGGPCDRDDVWFATTDADSVVPTSWFTDQVAYWTDYDVVVGTVRVDWSVHSLRTRRRYDEAYRHRQGSTHGHVHGANLGMRSSTYHHVGGFHALAVSEDIDLVDRMSKAGARIAWDERNIVKTSDRRTPRARGGFGDYLRQLEHKTEAGLLPVVSREAR